MNCYPVIHHTRRIARGIWHGIRAKAVVTIVCVSVPVWLIPAPATLVGVPGVDLPPVMLPWPGGDVWGLPPASWLGEPSHGMQEVGRPGDVGLITQSSDIYQSSVTPSIPVRSLPTIQVPTSNQPVQEPSTIAVFCIGLIVLRRIKRDQTN